MAPSRQHRHATSFFASILIVLLVTPLPLSAYYINPGTGLLIWQLLGAFLVGCGYQARKVLMRFRGKK